MNDTDRMKELVSKLNEAAKAYYAEDREIMSNLEYDRLYDELVALEEKTGVVLAASPTQSVGYEAVDELPKERHESPMLSLGKTKSREELADWLGDQKGLLSWKLDGLTIVLTYRDGKLFKAVTRGNGEIGEVITPNAKTFVNVPLQIPYQGELILRGEAVITYADFEKINGEIEDVDARYKNPRNLCSGSVRQLNSQITAQRKVHFFAFALVRAEGVDFKNSREEQFIFLQKQGFETVEYKEKTVELHLDYFGKQTIREIMLFTNHDTIVGDIAHNMIHFLKTGETIEFQESRDDFQIRELEHFLDIISGNKINDSDINHAIKVLKLTQGE